MAHKIDMRIRTESGAVIVKRGKLIEGKKTVTVIDSLYTRKAVAGQIRSKTSLAGSALSQARRNSVKPKTEVEKIEDLLGLTHVAPITITESDASDMTEDAEYFKGWYEDELKRLYEES